VPKAKWRYGAAIDDERKEGRMIQRWIPGLVLGGLIAFTAGGASANDTELTFGGTPRPLNGNTTVSMKNEYVKMVIDDEWVTVDCRFTFENKGPARKVRMGFPDQGGEPDEDEHGKPLPVKGTFKVFKSWVDGKPVKTKVIKGEGYGDRWHVKVVEFPANSTLQVRDYYKVEVGSSVAFSPVSVRMAEYVLHTGASWHGNIGRSVVEAEFKGDMVKPPLVVKPMPAIDKEGKANPPWNTARNRVYYEGPCKPAVSGRTLRFVRTDWRPGKKDDVLLVFGLKKPRAGNGG
jgi:hypothetical protein